MKDNQMIENLDHRNHYYIAPRVKDVRKPVIGSVIRNCSNCNDKVLVDGRLLRFADESLGIVCVPDIQEMAGKTIGQLVHENIGHMTAIIKKKIDGK